MSALGKNFEKLESNILNIPTDIVDSMRKNNLVTSVVLLFILYFILAAPKMSRNVTKIFNNNLFKLVYIFLVVCLVSKNPAMALIVAFVLVIGLNQLIKATTNQQHRDTLEVPYKASAFVPKNVDHFSDNSYETHPNNNNVVHKENKENKEHFNNDESESESDNIEFMSARQQMNAMWENNQNKDPALLEGFITKGQNKKCASVDTNSNCDVLGANEYRSTSHARVAENDNDCPENGGVEGFYENTDKQYGMLSTIEKTPLSQ
jgi:hypothetical protein